MTVLASKTLGTDIGILQHRNLAVSVLALLTTLAGEIGSLEVLPIVSVHTGEFLVLNFAKWAEFGLEEEKEEI